MRGESIGAVRCPHNRPPPPGKRSCVGVGGHMHDGIDRAFKAQVVARVGTEEKRVTEYGWEVHPFSGQMTMTLARRKMKVGKPVVFMASERCKRLHC